jgi:FkbM family methyltransferase
MVRWLNRPEYLYQPGKLVRRVFPGGPVIEGEEIVGLPWKLPLEVDSSETIGRIISHHGIFEMPVVEAMFRLIDPGDLVFDVGANIGYMTAVALSAGAARVIAFEPHPALFSRLERNVARWSRDQRFAGRIDARQEAISSRKGGFSLFVPKRGFAENQGLATLEERPDREAYNEVPITATTLDAVIAEAGASVGVLKIDIEDHESQAFKGGSNSLAGGRIRDIIYEGFSGADSDASRLLINLGYAIFGLQSTVFGPVLVEGLRAGKRRIGDHNLVATLDPGRLRKRMSAKGFRCLSRAAKAGLSAGHLARTQEVVGQRSQHGLIKGTGQDDWNDR